MTVFSDSANIIGMKNKQAKSVRELANDVAELLGECSRQMTSDRRVCYAYKAGALKSILSFMPDTHENRSELQCVLNSWKDELDKG